MSPIFCSRCAFCCGSVSDVSPLTPPPPEQQQEGEALNVPPRPDGPLIFRRPPLSPLSPLPIHSLPLHLWILYPPLLLMVFFFFFNVSHPLPHPLPSASPHICSSLQDLLFLLPPGKWHRITYCAVKANLFITTISLYRYCIANKRGTGASLVPLSCTRKRIGSEEIPKY